MTCNFCGTNNPDTATFCTNCGSALAPANSQNTYNQGQFSQSQYNQAPYGQTNPYQTPGYESYGYNQPAPNPGLGFAIAGMVCGIVSFFCFAYILGTLGIIFGAVAKSKGCKNGMATAGIVCGILGIGLFLIMQIALLL